MSIYRRIRRNPVMVGASLVMLLDYLESGDPITWRSAAVLVVGIAVRWKVTPTREVLLALEQGL